MDRVPIIRGNVCVFIRGSKFLKDLFQGNFIMALCSFGGLNDQCGATSWAAHEIGMFPLLTCDKDITAWLKCASGASRVRGRPGDAKATGDSKDQSGIINVLPQMAFIAIQETLPTEERRRYKVPDIAVSKGIVCF